MKKIIALALSLILVFSLVACGEDAFKGTWKGFRESDESNVTIEFDGAGKVTNFEDDTTKAQGTYKNNGDGTITITLDAWDAPVTYVYDSNSLNQGLLLLHDVNQALPGYQLELAK